MRILGADYSTEHGCGILFISIIDKIEGNMIVVATEQIEDVISKKQAIKLCKQIYNKYDCDKMVVENDLKDKM